VFLEERFDHAVWGAEVVLAPLNLTHQVLDGVRNHSWSRPAPSTPEAEVVSWADRCAYSAHDLEDAARAGIVTPDMLPAVVAEQCGRTRSQQLRTFVTDLVETITATGVVGMSEPRADALAALRAFNYERIYLRPASLAQAELVIDVLQALVECFSDRPNLIPDGDEAPAGSPDAVRRAVTYVGGMTDRYAFRCAVALLGWDASRLPRGI
jgi:dGTPase